MLADPPRSDETRKSLLQGTNDASHQDPENKGQTKAGRGKYRLR